MCVSVCVCVCMYVFHFAIFWVFIMKRGGTRESLCFVKITAFTFKVYPMGINLIIMIWQSFTMSNRVLFTNLIFLVKSIQEDGLIGVYEKIGF